MRTLLRKLAWWAGRRRREAELRDELDFHMSQELEDRLAAGLPEAHARIAARRDLGNMALVVEDTRAAWGWLAVEQLVQDVRYGARTLVRTPSLALAAVLTLAIGIGLTTAIFSIVYGVLLRPLPFPESERLVALRTVMGHGDSEDALSPPNVMSLAEAPRQALSRIAGYVEASTTLTGAAEARRVSGARVTADFFAVLGEQAALGRALVRGENEPGRDRVTVLSHTLWQRQFAGAPDIVGRTIRLDGVPHTVVGIMPAGFQFPHGTELWVPQPYGRNYFSSDSVAGRKNNAFVGVIGRLGAAATAESVRDELDRLARRLEQRFPVANAEVRFAAVPLHDALVGDVRSPILLLFGAVGFVLFIANANVAGLLLARGASRRGEMAIRGALGAGRARVVRQLVTESLLVGAAGGVAGVALAYALTSWFVVARAADLQQSGLQGAIRLDGIVLAFAAGTAVVTGVLAGLLPALRTADTGLAPTLRASGRGGQQAAGGQRLRSGLVVGQLALAVVLVSGAGLMLHSFLRLAAVEAGFQTTNALSFHLDLPASDYPSGTAVQAFFGALLDDIAAQPGVVSAAAISRLPIGQPGRFMSRFRVDGRGLPGDEELSIGARIVTPDYFRTLGIPIVRGRAIGNSDKRLTPPVVVINEAAAAWLFPGTDPVGHRLTDFGYDPIENAARAFTIVGVAGNVRSRGLREDPFPEAYFAHAQVPLPDMFVIVGTAGDPLAAMGAVRTAVISRDSNLPIGNPRTLDQVIATSLDRPRVLTALSAMLSGVALLLAAVGIYGLLSFSVEQRKREIGIRMALGASPRILVGTIVRHTLVLVTLGLGIGLAGGIGVRRLLASELYDVPSTDTVTIAGVVLTLAVTALVAGLRPARKAAAVDPMVALREG